MAVTVFSYDFCLVSILDLVHWAQWSVQRSVISFLNFARGEIEPMASWSAGENARHYATVVVFLRDRSLY